MVLFSFIGGLIIGLFSDKYGRIIFIKWMSIFTIIFSLLSGLCWYNFITLVIFWCLFGLTVKATFNSSYTYLAENLSIRIRGWLLCLVALFYQLG